MRALRFLAALALSLLLSLGDATAGTGWSNSWPALTTSGLAFGSLRASPPGGVQITAASTQSNLSQYVDYVPSWAAPSGPRFGDANFYVTSAGTLNPELCPGNTLTIDFRTVNIGGTVNTSTGAITGGTWYTVTWNGATSITIENCGYALSDPLKDGSGNIVTPTPGASYFVRTSETVATGGGMPTNAKFLPRYSHQYWGDGTEWTAAPQSSKATSGNIAAFSNGAAGTIPSFVVWSGWDGSSPVAILVGDSICNWQADYDFTGTRPAYGYLERGLDDSASGRWAFGNFCSSGTKPQDQSTIAANQYQLRMRMLRTLPNQPYNRVVSEMAQNGFFTNLSLTNFQYIMWDWWTFWYQSCPTCKFYQTTFPPHPTALNNSFWSDQINQTTSAGDVNYYPTGLRYTLMAWLEGTANGSLSLPSWLVALPVESAFADTTYLDHWKTNANQYTLANAYSSGVTSLSVAGSVAPTVGDVIVLEPTTSNAETRNVYAVSGASSPWTVTVISATSKAHANGASALISYTSDGTHPSALLHKNGAVLIEGYKTSGLLN